MDDGFVVVLGAHAQRRLQYLVCLSVFLSVTLYFGATGYESAYKGYQPLQTYYIVRKKSGFPEMTGFKRYAMKTNEKKPVSIIALPYLELIRLLCVIWRHNDWRYRLTHAIYYYSK
jgi:hypothetical protein